MQRWWAVVPVLIGCAGLAIGSTPIGAQGQRKVTIDDLMALRTINDVKGRKGQGFQGFQGFQEFQEYQRFRSDGVPGFLVL